MAGSTPGGDRSAHRVLSPWRRDGVPVGITATVAVLAVVYHRLFSGDVIFARDMIRWVLPARAVLRTAVAHHHLPVWNTLEGIGFPIPSDPLYGLFYPPTLVTLALPLATGAMVFMAAHLVWGALGSLVLARRLGASAMASILAALAWSLSGSISSEWTSGLRLVSSAWVPWAALAGLLVSDRARTSRGGSAAVLAAVPAGAVFLSGEVLLAVAIAGFTALVSLLTLLSSSDRTGRRRALHRWAIFITFALALAPLCGTATLLPAVRAASSTARAAPLSLSRAERVSIRPSRLIEFAAPDSLGHAYDVTDTPDVRHYFPAPPLSFSIYLGASVLALALVGVSRRRDLAWISALTLAVVLVSMGSATPAHAILRTVIPPLAYMRSPEKYLTFALPLIAVLAALGADAIATSDRRAWRLWIVPCALTVVSATARWLYLPGVAPFVSAGALRGALAAAALLPLSWLARRRPPVAGALILVVVALDLGFHVHGLQVYGSSSEVTADPPLAALIRADAVSVAPAPPRVYRAPTVDDALTDDRRTPARLQIAGSLDDNTSVLHGVGILPGYDAAIPATLEAILHTGRRDALRLLAVDHALLTVSPGTPIGAPRDGLSWVAEPFARVRLYRVERTLPRAYLAGSVTVSTSTDPVSVLRPEVLDGRTVVVDQNPGLAFASPSPRRDCTVLHFAPGDVTVQCSADGPQLAVLVEQSAAGWTATVDGARARWMTANLVSMAVRVPAGRHTIQWVYTAPWLGTGVALSVLGWVIVAAGWMQARRSGARGA